MIRARVLGSLWATRQCAGLRGRALKLCNELAPDGPTDRVVVAIDTLDARAGQRVLVAFGSGARNVLRPGPDNRELLCDAAVALIEEGD